MPFAQDASPAFRRFWAHMLCAPPLVAALNPAMRLLTFAIAASTELRLGLDTPAIRFWPAWAYLLPQFCPLCWNCPRRHVPLLILCTPNIRNVLNSPGCAGWVHEAQPPHPARSPRTRQMRPDQRDPPSVSSHFYSLTIPDVCQAPPTTPRTLPFARAQRRN